MDALESVKKEMLRRNYSLRTIKTYVYCLKTFLNSVRKPINKISKTDIIDSRKKHTSTFMSRLNHTHFS